MKIYLAGDHAGFHLKEIVKEALLGEGYEVEDLGAKKIDPHDNWSDIIPKAAEKISSFPTDKAIIFGGSGQGEAIIANKFPHVRAVVFYGPKSPTEAIDTKGSISIDPYEMLRLTRIHNNANTLSLGARFLTDEEALTAVRIWLTTEFTNEERHVRRLAQLEEVEKEIHDNH